MPTGTGTWLDGSITTALPLPDRGLDYGDGLFETLLLQGGRPLYLDFHLQRLQRGLQVLAFPDCLAVAEKQLLEASATLRERNWYWAVLRLTISRGAGPRGYAPPAAAQPRIIITATELDRDCRRMSKAVTLCLATMRCATQPFLAGIKHLNRLEQVLAAAECGPAEADEAIMLDQSGHLVSVTAGNLFLVRGKHLLTPALVTSGIAGTRRRLVMEKWAPAVGLSVQESKLTLRDLEAADEVFCSNSVHGVRPVARFGGRHWQGHPVCEALFQQYQGELH